MQLGKTLAIFLFHFSVTRFVLQLYVVSANLYFLYFINLYLLLIYTCGSCVRDYKRNTAFFGARNNFLFLLLGFKSYKSQRFDFGLSVDIEKELESKNCWKS